MSDTFFTVTLVGEGKPDDDTTDAIELFNVDGLLPVEGLECCDIGLRRGLGVSGESSAKRRCVTVTTAGYSRSDNPLDLFLREVRGGGGVCCKTSVDAEEDSSNGEEH